MPLFAVGDDLIHFAGSLDESLPRAVRRSLALAANRSVNGERTLFDDDDRASRMGMPPRVATRFDRDLHHHYIRSALKGMVPLETLVPRAKGMFTSPDDGVARTLITATLASATTALANIV